MDVDQYTLLNRCTDQPSSGDETETGKPGEEELIMNSMKLVILLHFTSCCDTTTTESIHIKDESKRDSAFALIFGVN